MTSLSNDNDVNDDDIDDNDDVNVNDVCQHFGKRRLKDFAAIRSSEEIKVLSQKVWAEAVTHFYAEIEGPQNQICTFEFELKKNPGLFFSLAQAIDDAN